MNEIERQILENQLFIMEYLDLNQIMKNNKYNLTEPITKTLNLLNPPKQQSIAERTHDALCEDSEVKKE